MSAHSEGRFSRNGDESRTRSKSAVRDGLPVLRNALEMWLSTVRILIPRCSAISGFER